MTDIGVLVNRVIKNQRHLQKWARREGIEAYRLYDRDIPEYPFAIDRYADWLQVQVFERRRPLEPAEIADMRAAMAEALQHQRAQVVIKFRRRQRGSTQYERRDTKAPSFRVHERGLAFEVNLERYLDTGLFLDHRETRAMIRARAHDAHFLNLFAYTGGFTVYAAAGGARRTVTVDLSKTYQAWSRRNLAHNGLDDPDRHDFVQTDAAQFIARMQRAGARFDLIVLDPPSFSNSKRMRETFDVQRDHLALVGAALELLTPAGELYFSNNRRGFRLDPALHERADVREITQHTVPVDFRRHKPHRCWVLRRD